MLGIIVQLGNRIENKVEIVHAFQNLYPKGRRQTSVKCYNRKIYYGKKIQIKKYELYRLNLFF